VSKKSKILFALMVVSYLSTFFTVDISVYISLFTNLLVTLPLIIFCFLSIRSDNK